MSNMVYVIWVENQTDEDKLYGAFKTEAEARRYVDAYLKSLPEPTEQLNTLTDTSEPVLTPLMGVADAWRTDDGLIQVNLVSLNLLDSCDEIGMDFNLQQYDEEWEMAKKLTQNSSLQTAQEELADSAGVSTESWDIEDAASVLSEIDGLETDDRVAVIDSIQPVMELYEVHEEDFTVNDHDELEYDVNDEVLLLIENWSDDDSQVNSGSKVNRKELGRALLIPKRQ